MQSEKHCLAEVEGWERSLIELHTRIGRHFRRAEPRQHALAYLRGLLSPVERKNGWQIAEWIGDLTPDGIQRLLASAKWDADLVRDDLLAYVTEHLADQEAILIVDETGFPKQGSQSVGVQRQYCGTTGQVENCQVGVFTAYATARGSTFLDRELYLPKTWISDPQRCREAGVPETIGKASKSELARQMIKRVRASGIPFAWIATDALYGDDLDLRTWLEEQHLPYVLAVHSDEPVTIATEQGRRMIAVKDAVQLLRASSWQRMSVGEGTKGPRVFDWACLAIVHGGVDDQQHWLLIRRQVTDQTEMTFYLVYGPRGTTLQQMVQVAGARWSIEEILEAGKVEVGLDHYEVRLWTSWYRHITLAMLAQAYLTVMRAQSCSASSSDPREAAEDLLPLTIPEVRHVLWQIMWPHAPPLCFVLAWSSFRRRHQARAKRAHVKRRCAQLARIPPASCQQAPAAHEQSKRRPVRYKGGWGPRLLTVIQHAGDDQYLLISETAELHPPLPGSAEWQTKLEQKPSFHFCGKNGHFTARKEKRQRGGDYWYAYRRHQGKQYSQYIGTAAMLLPAHLEQVAAALETRMAIPFQSLGKEQDGVR